MTRVSLPESAFASDAAFHEAVAKALGLPDFYGKNWDALVDCLVDIEDPEGMTKVRVEKGGTLEIGVEIGKGAHYYETRTWALFASAVAAANGSFLDDGSDTRVVIAETVAGR